MNTSGSFAYLGWPFVALGGFALMVFFLRWTFSSGSSVVQRRPRTGSPGEYGLLVPVAEPDTMIEGEQLRLRLVDSNLRATLVETTQGPRLMVFAKDASIARSLLSSPGPDPGRERP